MKQRDSLCQDGIFKGKYSIPLESYLVKGIWYIIGASSLLFLYHYKPLITWKLEIIAGILIEAESINVTISCRCFLKVIELGREKLSESMLPNRYKNYGSPQQYNLPFSEIF